MMKALGSLEFCPEDTLNKIAEFALKKSKQKSIAPKQTLLSTQQWIP